MTIRDNALIVRATSDTGLAATANYEVELNGTGLEGLSLCVYIPSTDSATDQSLAIYIYASTASTVATTDPIIAQLVKSDVTLNTLNDNLFVLPFTTEKRTIEVEFLVAGTSPTYGVVLAWITHQVQHTWSRLTDFHS